MRTSDKAKRSAINVGRMVAFLGRDEKLARLLPTEAATLTEELMLAVGLIQPWMLRLWGLKIVREVAAAVERLTAPGQLLALALRKRFMDEETRRALDGGARQLLVVGGGFDTLALRVSRDRPDVLVVETDLVGTLSDKVVAIRARGPLPPNLKLRTLDLDESQDQLEGVLASAGWQRDAPSVVVAEAVLMYVRPAGVSAFLRGMRACTGPGTTLQMTWRRRDGRRRMPLGSTPRLMRAGALLAGEPLLWALSDVELHDLLTASGFAVDSGVTRSDMRHRFLDGVPGLEGALLSNIERFCTAAWQPWSLPAARGEHRAARPRPSLRAVEEQGLATH